MGLGLGRQGVSGRLEPVLKCCESNPMIRKRMLHRQQTSGRNCSSKLLVVSTSPGVIVYRSNCREAL